MSNKLQEYLDVIASEKSGEDVRDAIEKAIITVDADNAKNGVQAIVSQYMETVDQLLNMMWDDVMHVFPVAVRPSYDDTEETIEPMNNELTAFLMSLANSISGMDIRAAMWGAMQNISNSIIAHNLIREYYAKRVIDLFNAFIAASDDDERKEAAKSRYNSWDAVINYNAFGYVNNTITSDLLLLREVKNGLAARPLLLESLQQLNVLNERRATWYREDFETLLANNAYDIEKISEALSDAGDTHVLIYTGERYTSESDATNRLNYIENAGTPYEYSIIVRGTLPIYWYVVITDVAFYTKSFATIWCQDKNTQYSVLDCKPLYA